MLALPPRSFHLILFSPLNFPLNFLRRVAIKELLRIGTAAIR